MKSNENRPIVTSVKIGAMEMAVSEQSLRDLCEIKSVTGTYSRSIDRVMRKLIDVGVCNVDDNKSEYIFLLRDLQDMKDHYSKIAKILILKDGEEVKCE